MLIFEYIQDQQALVLTGEAVAAWDEADRMIGRLSMAELMEHKRAFRNDVRNLEQRHSKCLSYKHHPGYVAAMLTELFMAGRKFWRTVSGGQLPWLLPLGEALTHHMGAQWWMIEDARAISSHVYHIESKGPPQALLPLDSLPLGEMEKAVVSSDEADVRLLAALFGGFNSIVRYTPLQAGEFLHPHVPGKMVTLFLRSTAVDALDEMRAVLGKGKGVLLGPFPSRGAYEDPADIARSLLLSEPARGPNPLVPDLVQIYAHAAENPGLAASLTITFAFGRNKPVTVMRSSHVENVLMELERLRRGARITELGPLVIFNACEALGTIGNEPTSTGLDLSLNGSRAVVGPREEVLAQFAVRFSETIHTALDEGHSIGEAVVRARWTTLGDLLNPSGLLYATFGDVETTRGVPFEDPGGEKTWKPVPLS
ncbi:hypothetical protein [Rhodococcus sp. IEGM 1307]|uniref:hypothetical protein n=1 Tax=Rhodococcus sp. IEGM 1307 TaxID=3047091 RepID=UPI0024B7E0BB|nr:hypothetical protein [Rhodococcus sp. IEGM 1307]MDI9978807.1 hypothetical protein [Rhodococcus sp. IEGM 1307]